tara:strand:+ start:1780 stop:2085 length:306 start_codon:yes stop_codon:yes gene_type:complete
MSDELNIKVTLGNRVYPLTIEREEEEIIRKAAKMVNENMRELESSYAVRDKQDLLAMTALFFANKAIENSNNNSLAVDELEEGLQHLNKRIADYLRQNERS